MACRLAVCVLLLMAATVRADETNDATDLDHSPCGAGVCGRCSHDLDSSGATTEKSYTALDADESKCDGKCSGDKSAAAACKNGKCCAGKVAAAKCSTEKCCDSDGECATCTAAGDKCNLCCAAGEKAVTLDESLVQAASLTFNVVSSAAAPCAPRALTASLPTHSQDLLEQKLAERDQLQQEIDELCETTQTWQQVLVRVKVMEISLTKMRKLGIDFSGNGLITTSDFQVDHAYTPPCECTGETCSTDEFSTEKCATEKCATGSCKAGECSAEKCSSDKCSGEEFTAGACHGEKCSAAVSSVVKACSRAYAASVADGETCADGECCSKDTSCESCAFTADGNDLASLLESLEQRNVAKVLAAPTVVTVSGRPVSIHVGGEVPVPGGDDSSYQFVDFGTKLDVLPISIGANKVRLEVRPRICEISDERSLEVAGGTVPSFRVCQCDTACEMEFGQTAALSGLVTRRVEAVQTENGISETANDVLLVVVVTPEKVSTTASRSTVTK